MSIRVFVVACAALVSFFASDARAQSCIGGAPGGGDVSALGECDGSDAIFCDTAADTIVRVPCAALAAGAPVGSCRVYEGFGSWCAFDDGDACVIDLNGQVVQFACTTPSSGCVDGVCAAGNFDCTPPNPDNPPALSCANSATVDQGCAPWGQEATVSCELVTPGSSCVEGGPDGASCVNGDCGSAGAGTCDGATAIVCSGGVEESSENCATFGQACVQDAAGDTPRCVTADPQCGPSGLGDCAGNTATICSGGAFQTETDCAAIGLVCGPVAGAGGRIGCIEPGAGEGEGEPGEGEGEGAAECDSDSDCDDDEECNDGECEEEDSPRRGGGGGGPVEPAPLCAEAGTLPVGLSLGALLILALRRRRR